MSAENEEYFNKIYEEMNIVLAEMLNIIASQKFLSDLIKDSTLEKNLLLFPEFDTMCRDEFLDLFSKKLINKKWPNNSDKEKSTSEFFKKLHNEAKKSTELTFSSMLTLPVSDNKKIY